MRINFISIGLLVLLMIGARIEGQASMKLEQADSLCRRDVLFQQANLRVLNRNWVRAIPLYQQALRENCGSVESSQIHQNLGCIYFLTSDYEHAVIQFEYAYSLMMMEFDNDNERLAEICMNIASTYYEMNKLDKSLVWWDKIRKRIIEDTGLWSLRCALGRGNIYFQLGDYHHALAEYSIPIPKLSQHDKPTNEEIWIRKNRALCYRELGQLDSANASLMNAIKRIDSNEGLSDLIPDLLYLEGDLWLETGRPEIALDLFEHGLNRLQSSSLKQTNGVIESRSFKTSDVTRHMLLSGTVLAKYQLLQGIRKDSSWQEDLLLEIVQVIEHGERLRQIEYLGDILSAEPESQLSLYNLAMELLFQMNNSSNQFQQQVLNIAERQREFYDKIGDSEKWPEEIHSEKDSIRINQVRRRSFQLHKQHIEMDPERFSLNMNFPEKRFRVRSELDSIRKKINMESDGTIIPWNPIPKIQEVSSLLKDNEAILEFMVTDSTLFSFCFSSDSSLFIRSRLDSTCLVDSHRFSMALKRGDYKGFNKLSNKFYHRLISPFQSMLNSKTKLLIMPGYELAQIPFEVLRNNRKFLINNYEISYHLSISAWFYDQVDKRTSIKLENKYYHYDFTGCAPDFSKASKFVELPYSFREVDLITKMFNQASKTTRKVKSGTVLENSFIDLAGLSRIVHIASHGQKDQKNPELSGWILSPDPTPSPTGHSVDESLDMGELQSFRLKSDLITFSTCSIGSEGNKTWYRMTGFPRNFLKAGVNHILFSMWNVSDKHTHQFMVSFYRHVLAGNSYPASLRKAKLNMLESPETAIPTIWAPFVLWSK